MRILTCALLFGFLLLSVDQDAKAQEKQPKFSFEIQTMVEKSKAVAEHFPITLMDKLITHEELSSTNISEDKRAYHIQAEFQFVSVKKFQSWYQSKEVSKMIKKLKGQSQNFEFNYMAIR